MKPSLPTTHLVGVVQLTSTSDQGTSMAMATALVEEAARAGARFVATPECTNYLGPHDRKVEIAETLSGETCERFSHLARRLGIWLLLGSFNERCDEEADTRCYNTSVLFRDDGEIAATYRKVHLFDVDVSDEVRFQESATCVPGSDLVVARTDLGTLGLSICYDLRFPEMYRGLVNLGADILMVPSAFTAHTGQAHWEALLRARAIENQCYVLAPAQVGHHDDGGLRNSYGHSLVIDPWGQVLASAGDTPGLALAPLDSERTREIRRSMPIAEHRKFAD